MRGDGVSTLYVMRGHAAVSGLEPARRGTPREIACRGASSGARAYVFIRDMLFFAVQRCVLGLALTSQETA